MQREAPDADRYVTFEVTVPRDSDEGIAALRGIATALGWPTRQRATLPTDLNPASLPKLWRIEDEQFLEASLELWETDDYGVAAVKRLQQERQECHMAGDTLWADGAVDSRIHEALGNVEIGGAPFITRWKDGKYRGGSMGYQLSDEALLKRGQALWDHHHRPFTMVTSFQGASNLDGSRRLVLSPGDVTRDRLADYVRGNGYDNHHLHGTIGKMFDTINIVAGVVERADIGERNVDGDFLDRHELERMMEAAELTTRAGNDIHRKVWQRVVEQLASGLPYEHGEIIIEGKSIGRDYEHVAVRSLAVLIHSFKSRKETPTTRFLRQFA